MQIRPMTPEDLGPALAAIGDVGWGDLRPHFAFYFGHACSHPFVAEVEGRIVGTATGTQKGAVGWLGHVIVAPESRNRGTGTALTDFVTRHLEGLGCRTLALIATELGRPVYEKLGYSVETHYHSLHGPTLADLPRHPSLRPLAATDLPAIRELDRYASGEDRSALLRALGPKGWVLTDGSARGVRGYYAPAPWGEGGAVTLDHESGCILLDLVRAVAGRDRGQSAVRITLPAANEAGREHLLAAGFAEVGRLARMIRGQPLDWHPTAIWSRFSGALG